MTGLTLREFLEVPELRFNRVDVVSGELWNSIAYGTVESVDTANRVVTLKLEEGELAGLHVNDICRGIFHNLTGNADGNRVDCCGFLTMAGFSTVYFTPTEIVGNGKFRYELKPGTSVHPCPAMKFAVYGNFTDKTRRASAYSTRTYKRYLTGVATWEVDPERNIAMQFGDLSGLHVGGVSMEGYSAYLNNIYMKGHLEFTDGQREELKGENGYTVLLTTYDAVVAVDSEGKIDSSLYDIVNVVDGEELVKAGNDTVVVSRFKIQTRIQAYKAGALTYAETPGEGEYAVALTAKGCEYVFADGVLTITKIMVDKATVEIEVNCEGKEVFLKLFTLTRLYGGSDAVYMDLTNENASVTCDTEGVVTGSIPGSTAKVYVGTALDGAWSFSGSFSGCTGSVNASTGAITVTGLTEDSGSVTVTATKRGYASLTAVYSLSKAYPGPNGEPAVVYSVRPSADVIVKDKTGTFTPASISCEKLKQIGNSAPYVTTEKTLKYQLSDGNLTDYTGAVSVGSATWIEFTLYEGSTVLDRERVPVIADGKDGIDANLLDWIEEWNGNKTDVGRELIISPRMVAGKKESSGKFTGVMFGRDMIEVNGVMQTGLFGMKNGDLTFSIDAQTGDAFFGGTVLVRKDAKNYVTMNYKDANDWGLKGVVNGNEDKPVFQLGSTNQIGEFMIEGGFLRGKCVLLTNSNIRFDRDDGAVVNIGALPGEGLGGAPVLGYLKDGKGSAPEFDATNSVALFLGSQYYKPYGSLDSYAKYALYAQGMSMLHSVSTRVIDGTFDGGMSDWNWRVFLHHNSKFIDTTLDASKGYSGQLITVVNSNYDNQNLIVRGFYQFRNDGSVIDDAVEITDGGAEVSFVKYKGKWFFLGRSGNVKF